MMTQLCKTFADFGGASEELRAAGEICGGGDCKEPSGRAEASRGKP